MPATDSPRLAGLQAEIAEHQGRIARAERDYDDGLLEAVIRALPRGAVRIPVLAVADPAQHFLDADLNTQRHTIEALATVRLFPQPRGRKGFDPDSVDVDVGDQVEIPVIAE